MTVGLLAAKNPFIFIFMIFFPGFFTSQPPFRITTCPPSFALALRAHSPRLTFHGASRDFALARWEKKKGQQPD